MFVTVANSAKVLSWFRWTRVFYCTILHKRIVMLHVFIKKSQKTPKGELEMAKRRQKEILRK
ncbi:MAG: type II toxin-antitoxin system RelE/ParE family toxin [Prochloron sp. SP5CPC1]|nr:type II toxin-antitoxin system RelE/ParE family toxin [Candidatus Paraprochloron terpiosi SP5CPC1]